MSVVFVEKDNRPNDFRLTSEVVKKMLEENTQLIEIIHTYQVRGRNLECLEYQKILQRNLIFLAKLTDTKAKESDSLGELLNMAGRLSLMGSQQMAGVEPAQTRLMSQQAYEDGQNYVMMTPHSIVPSGMVMSSEGSGYHTVGLLQPPMMGEPRMTGARVEQGGPVLGSQPLELSQLSHPPQSMIQHNSYYDSQSGPQFSAQNQDYSQQQYDQEEPQLVQVYIRRTQNSQSSAGQRQASSEVLHNMPIVYTD